MSRVYLIRFNKFDLVDRWVVEDAITHDLYPCQSITIQTHSFTHEDRDRTLFSICTTGILVWEGKNAIIK